MSLSWLLLCFTGYLVDGARPFVATWNIGSTFENVTLPLTTPLSNLTIDWGDGTPVDVFNDTVSEIGHQYIFQGIYNMSVSGELHGIRFDSGIDAEKLLFIADWGDEFFMDVTSSNAFAGCINLQVTALPTFQPVFLPGATLAGMFMNTSVDAALDWNLTNVVSTASMFKNATKMNHAITFGNTQQVTSTANMFAGATSFNSQAVFSDTGAVTDMSSMFEGTLFNQPVNYNSLNVRNMSRMFAGSAFNQAVAFDGSNLVDASSMFKGAQSFNSSLVITNTLGLGSTSEMFRGAISFDQSIAFQTDAVKDMDYMFESAWSFNQAVNFNTQNVQSMNYMFSNTDVFNQPINFNASSLTSAIGMFESAILFDSPVTLLPSPLLTTTNSMFHRAAVFNQPVTIQTDGVTSMVAMFCAAKSFNQPLSFNVGKLQVATLMFGSTGAFNQTVNLASPNLTAVDFLFANALAFNSPVNIASANLANTANMFQGAIAFNQPVILKTDSVVNMARMFASAVSFNQPVNFNTTAVTTMTSMFSGATMFNQPINFDARSLLFADYMFRNCVAFNSSVNLANSLALERTMSMFYGATVFNQPVTLQTDSVENMQYMFAGAKNFNRTVNFNTQNVRFMSYMFANAEAFNQPVNFSTRNLTTTAFMFDHAVAFNSPVTLSPLPLLDSTEGMFRGAKAFNQPITFPTDSVFVMSEMFSGATNFNQPLANNPPQSFFVTDSVAVMDNMLEGAVSFNQSIAFQASNLTSANYMLAGATSFNQPIEFFSNWQLVSVVGMLANASNFNQTVRFSTTSNIEFMDKMFAGALLFEQDLGRWDTNKVANCSQFCHACGLPTFPSCNPCDEPKKTSVKSLPVCNCPTNEKNVTLTQCVADLCKLYQIPPSLQLDCLGNTPPTPAPGPSSPSVIIISPLFNITEAGVNSSQFIFTLPIDPRAYMEVGTITQSCYGRELSCQWLDPETQDFKDSGCAVSQTNVDMGLGIVGTQCTCSHLTVFAIAMRSDLRLAPLCHAEEVDYVLLALYSALALCLVAQLARLFYYRLSRLSQIQHALLLLICVLRIAYLVAKPVINLPGLVFLGLLPSAFALTLFVALLLTWASLQMATLDRSPFVRFRVPFLTITFLFFTVVVAMVIAVAATADLMVVNVGSYLLAALYAVVCVLVLVAGLGLRRTIANNTSAHSSSGKDWRVLFRSRLLIATVSLSLSLFVAACLWVAAVQDDIIASSAATLGTTASFYFVDWLSLCVMTWLLSRAISEGAKKALPRMSGTGSSTSNLRQNESRSK